MIREDRTFFQYVLFSDKASFHNNGQLNRHKCPLLIHIFIGLIVLIINIVGV